MDRLQGNILTKLFFLITGADNETNYRELAMGKKMASEYGMGGAAFEEEIGRLKNIPKNSITVDCLKSLKELPRERQIDCMAWTLSMASADGCIASGEREFIHDTFEKSLGLSYDDIIEKRKAIMEKLGLSMM